MRFESRSMPRDNDNNTRVHARVTGRCVPVRCGDFPKTASRIGRKLLVHARSHGNGGSTRVVFTRARAWSGRAHGTNIHTDESPLYFPSLHHCRAGSFGIGIASGLMTTRRLALIGTQINRARGTSTRVTCRLRRFGAMQRDRPKLDRNARHETWSRNQISLLKIYKYTIQVLFQRRQRFTFRQINSFLLNSLIWNHYLVGFTVLVSTEH